jgi:hypothetical protein
MPADIMGTMKRVLLSFALSGAMLCAAGLPEVRKVYLLPMGNSLDQYLANRLTNEQIFQVVTDPTIADAVFTDRIGEPFQLKLDELLAPPEPPPAPEEKDKKETETRGDSIAEAPVNKLARAGAMSSLTRSRGTVFLVDAKTREVVWSAFEPPKDSTAKEMDRTAGALVTRIKKELKKK